MLENLRKQGASIAVYLIFGLLIVIFVLTIAPNAGPGSGGCMGPSTTAMTVDGHKANQTSFRIAYSGNPREGREKAYRALDLLIQRELLAQEAEARGLRVTGSMLDEEIKKGYFFLGGTRQKADFWIDVLEDDKGNKKEFFNFGKLKQWAQDILNVPSMNAYKEDQTRGLQAALMGEMLSNSVRVSREEAFADYVFENNTVKFDAVVFDPTPYRTAMRLADADVERFLKDHEAKVKQRFTDDERTYKATKPALKLRSIFVQKLAAPVPAEKPPEPQAPEGAGSGSAGSAAGSAAPPAPKPPEKAPEPAKPKEVKPVGMPIDEAKTKLEAARTAIAASKQTFADAAKQLATDDTAKASGGYIGWRPIDNAQLGDKAVNDAVKELKPGEMTKVIPTDNGVYLVLAEDKREGDLTYDQVKAEIATDLAKDIWSKEAAKRAALEAFALARAGNAKNLNQLFSPDPEVVKRKMQEEIQRQIQQMQLQQKQGFWTPPVSTNDVPASWNADDLPGTGSAPSGGSPPAGSATGGAGSAGSAGSASTPAPTPAPVPAPAPAMIEASKDVLPAFGEIAKPFLESVGPVPRVSELPGVGDSTAAINALFDELTPGMLGKQVYESNGTYLLVQLEEKKTPTVNAEGKIEEFEKTADEKIEMLRAIRGATMLRHWLATRCEQYRKDGKITPMAELIRESDEHGKPLPIAYRPCSRL